MTCARENELLDALGRGYVGSELGAHIASCTACTELRAVAGALLDDRAHAVAAAHVPYQRLSGQGLRASATRGNRRGTRPFAPAVSSKPLDS